MKKLIVAFLIALFGITANASDQCASGAAFVEAVGKARDAGASKEDVLKYIDSNENIDRLSSYQIVVRIIYERTDLNPIELATSFYNECKAWERNGV